MKLSVLIVLSLSALMPFSELRADPVLDACARGDLSQVQKLVLNKDDANRLYVQTTTDENGLSEIKGVSALDQAVANARPDVVEYLLSLGAKVDGPGIDETPLIAASRISPKQLTRGVDARIDGVAGVNERDRENDLLMTVVHLLNAKASLHKKGWRNKTALHWAAYFGRDTLSQLLLNNKAELNAEDSEGFTALDLAADQNRTNSVSFFLEKGAKRGSSAKTRMNADCINRSSTTRTLDDAFDTNVIRLLRRMSPFPRSKL